MCCVDATCVLCCVDMICDATASVCYSDNMHIYNQCLNCPPNSPKLCVLVHVLSIVDACSMCCRLYTHVLYTFVFVFQCRNVIKLGEVDGWFL